MWKTEVKVTETEQTSFPLLSSAAAVTFCPGRFGSRPSSAHLLQSIIWPLNSGAPHPAHTTVLIRLIGLDLELPPVPVAPAPVTCGPCWGCPGCWGGWGERGVRGVRGDEGGGKGECGGGGGIEERGGYWGRYGPAEAAWCALTVADGRLWGRVPNMKCVWWVLWLTGCGVWACPGWVWECAWGWENDKVSGGLVPGPPAPLTECVGCTW